jgi:hypothetical protein
MRDCAAGTDGGGNDRQQFHGETCEKRWPVILRCKPRATVRAGDAAGRMANPALQPAQDRQFLPH